MKNGWTFRDIEEMDIYGFLNVMNGPDSKQYDDIEAFYNSI
ncbi:hypothetical protein AB434_3196 [Heyndrickxia coagulans]|nr:hypothetical protein [Heyndrickxia coagulans]AKN55601.1 hypothetical protein AB434_3196 [Heyndrickxia coagulans]KYC71634.1 hypothetical protein B4099_3175 [Heyndrickxia coagulans]MCW8782995.1 hypothetical protein [Heyndrickxia coagulans]